MSVLYIYSWQALRFCQISETSVIPCQTNMTRIFGTHTIVMHIVVCFLMCYKCLKLKIAILARPRLPLRRGSLGKPHFLRSLLNPTFFDTIMGTITKVSVPFVRTSLLPGWILCVHVTSRVFDCRRGTSYIFSCAPRVSPQSNLIFS